MAINKNVLAEKQATVLSEDGNTMYATIQMRHGKESEMDKSKFVPAEMGVATDSKKVFMGFAPNDVEEMALKKDIPDGTMDYGDLENKPSIGGIELKGNKTLEQLGIQPKGNYLTKVPDEYVTDNEMKTELAKKLDKNQGTENAGKALVVGKDGNVIHGGNLESLAIKLTASGDSPLSIRDSSEWKVQNFAMQGWTEQDGTPSPENPVPIVSAGTKNQENGKWEYEITITNAQTDPDKNQTVTLTADRPLTKWDKLEKRGGQWGWVYKSGMHVFDGTERLDYTIGSYPRLSWTNFYNDNLGAINAVMYMENLRYAGNNVKEENILSGSAGFARCFMYFDSTVDSKEAAVAKIMGQQIIYESAEESFIPLTESEQTALEALTTYFPTTIISNDADCEMEIEYVADTKTYIDNKFAELAQNLAATQNTLLEV